MSPPSTSTQQVFSSEKGSSQKAAVTVAGPPQPDSGHSSSLFVPVLTQLQRSYHNGLYHTTLLAPLRQGDHGQGVGCGECGGSALGRGHCVCVGRGQLSVLPNESTNSQQWGLLVGALPGPVDGDGG